MIGKTVGSLNTIPAPSSAVLGESLKFLSTFGDKRSISALLEQVRDVQAHNEQVFKDAQEAIAALRLAQQETDENRKALEFLKSEQNAINHQRTMAISQAEARLSGKASTLANEQALVKSALDEREKNLSDRERIIISRESKCDETGRDLESRLAVISNKEASLRDREQQLQMKENKLRAVLDG